MTALSGKGTYGTSRHALNRSGPQLWTRLPHDHRSASKWRTEYRTTECLAECGNPVNRTPGECALAPNSRDRQALVVNIQSLRPEHNAAPLWLVLHCALRLHRPRRRAVPVERCRVKSRRYGAGSTRSRQQNSLTNPSSPKVVLVAVQLGVGLATVAHQRKPRAEAPRVKAR